MAHLSCARSCKWYNKGKNVDHSTTYILETMEASSTGTEVGTTGRSEGVDHEDPIENHSEYYQDIIEDRNLFQFVFPPYADNAGGNEASTSASGQASDTSTRYRQTVFALDDDKDLRVEEENSLHGRVIRMSATVVETWKAFFGEDDNDPMDIDDKEGQHLERWRPFASELDWRVAMWAVRENVGQNALNRLLAIPGVIVRFSLFNFWMLTSLIGSGQAGAQLQGRMPAVHKSGQHT